jgi:hypothetical protein
MAFEFANDSDIALARTGWHCLASAIGPIAPLDQSIVRIERIDSLSGVTDNDQDFAFGHDVLR